MTVSDATGLLTYSESLEQEIFEFQRSAYPQRPAETIPARWRWMFVESARRLDVPPMVWVYRNDSQVLAHQGALAVKLKVDEQEYTTGWFVETMALESVRGGAVGPAVIMKAKSDLPFNLSLGQTSEMRAIQFRLGWQQVAPLETYVFALNPKRVIAPRKLNSAVKPFLSMGLNLKQKVNGFRGRGQLPWTPTVVPLERFNERHDQLWERVSKEIPCAVVRDASYLNWKYVDQPCQQYIRLEIQRRGEPVAVAVLLIREPGEVYQYRRAFLVDLVVPPAETDTVMATLQTVHDECLSREIDLIAFSFVSRQLQQSAEAFGFQRREPERYLLISAESMPSDVRESVLNPDKWLVTMGDSDIDRPSAS